MSCDPDTPYKSRLFNFLNRKSIIWNERLGRTIRHVKVAASWGLQILLYPAYLLVQTGRLARRKLGQKLAQTQLLLPSSPRKFSPPPTISSPLDTPIDSVLAEIGSWFSFQVQAKAIIRSLQDSHNQYQSQLIKPEMIQGIASLTENHHLVLVNQDNQILDVLSTNQQQELNKRISWEVANYLYHQHQTLPTSRVNYLPKLPIHNPHLLPPVRWSWQVISWLQTSVVASEINLFGESSLVKPVTSVPLKLPELLSEEEIPIPPQLPQEGFWLSLDNTFANLEQNASLSTRQWEQIWLELPQKLTTIDSLPELNKVKALIWSAIAHFFSRQSNPSLTASPDSTSLSSQTAQTPSTLPTNPFNLKILIQAALDYFFGSPPILVETAHSPDPSLNYASHDEPSLPQGEITLEDPWLAWDSSLSESNSKKNNQDKFLFNSDVTSANLPQLNSNPNLLPPSPHRSIREIIKQKLSFTLLGKRFELTKASSSQLTQSPSSQHQIVQAAKTTRQIEIKKASHSATAVNISELGEQPGELSSDVVETSATTVGYAQHPFMRLVEWLDENMLKVEELLIRIWRKIRQQG